MRWDLLFFQQLLYSALHGKLHESQPFRAKVVSAVPLESEIKALPQMISMFVDHDLFVFSYEIIIYTRHLRFGILQNVFLALEGFGACQIQQRSRGNDLVGVAVHEEAKIPIVPVGIENHGAKHNHVIQCLHVLLA